MAIVVSYYLSRSYYVGGQMQIMFSGRHFVLSCLFIYLILSYICYISVPIFRIFCVPCLLNHGHSVNTVIAELIKRFMCCRDDYDSNCATRQVMNIVHYAPVP